MGDFMDFTFLTKDQVDNLDMFKNYGTQAAITDFSILLGGCVDDDNTINDSVKLEDRTGWYWTKSKNGNYICTVASDGTFFNDDNDARNTGARPTINYSIIKHNISNTVRGVDGVLRVEYGEYPQKAVDENMQEKLENAFIYRLLRRTGKTYTTDSQKYDDYSSKFKPQTLKEYEYEGKKYVRVIVNSYFDGNEFQLSTACEYMDGDYVWVEVSPITWLVDEKNDIAVSEKILFAGVQFNHDNDYNGIFKNTDIKKYLDNYFSKEIISDVVKEMTEEEKIAYEEDQKRLEKMRNPYGFNFDEVDEEDIIRLAIESDLSVFLHGRSSEGKSARVKQIDPECVIIYLRNATPESLNGKSVYNSDTGEMIDVKPTWLVKIEEKCEKEPNKLHIVFLDEITNALPSIQGIAFNIVLDKEVNGKWKLPENARIVAAGNEMKDSLAANKLAEPLFNRFVHIYIETTVEKWLKWASENNIHPAIYSYIAYKREDALRSEYNGETPNADPRKWEMASKLLHKTGRPEALRGIVGEEITREFVQFCNQRVITLEDVLNDNYTERDLEMNISEKYATVIGLTIVDEENFIKVREFVEKLGPELLALFESMWSKGDESRLEIIAEAKLIKAK